MTPLRCIYLLDDVDAVVKLLFLQEWMNMTKECSQVRVTIAIRNNECYSMTWPAGARFPDAADFDVTVQSLQLVVRRRPVADIYEPNCTQDRKGDVSTFQ